MKINANGISINYQIDGPEGAPWLIFSQFADHQSLDVGRPGRRAEEHRSACCATTSAATAARRRPTASTRFDMLVADVVALMDALVDQARAFLSASPWAA